MGLIRLIIESGGWLLVPIVLLSIAACAIVVERLWRLLPMRARFAAVRSDFHEALMTGGAEAAWARLDGTTPLGRVLRAGLAVRSHGPELMRVAGLDAAQREVPALERGLGVLLVATQVAPLIGLLGTVIGLIEAFQAASQGDEFTTKLLAGGVYKALAATVAGLLIAIPAFLAYGGLSGLVARLSDQLEHAATDLPLIVKGA
ncbi:MAG: MotA/TolQ/ExbB proton channel family protein [Planctomycetes bacterium]|nr:MotA/TolQ/ExbB proton channel family protein [Planctomycetota bacterium]